MTDKMGDWLKKQILVQKEIRDKNLCYLDEAPDGVLKIRKQNNRQDLRKVSRDLSKASGFKEQAINNNSLMVAQLIQKEISIEVVNRCTINMKNMEQLLTAYLPLDGEAIKMALPDAHKQFVKSAQELLQLNWADFQYEKRVDRNHRTVHATRKGDWVASKSEVIIANALYENGIPYRYDQRSTVISDRGYAYYPDFTILLPDGREIYWEHFGMLADEIYMQQSLKKLLRYHQAGITIGKNLLISVDDIDGNCDSPDIYNMIQQSILPYFL